MYTQDGRHQETKECSSHGFYEGTYCLYNKDGKRLSDRREGSGFSDLGNEDDEIRRSTLIIQSDEDQATINRVLDCDGIYIYIYKTQYLMAQTKIPKMMSSTSENIATTDAMKSVEAFQTRITEILR